MENKEQRLIKNTLLFSLGNVGSKLLMLVIVPLYTYYVSVEQMGQYDMVHAYTSLFAPLACIAIYESVYRWLLDANENKEKVFFNGFLTTIISLGIFDIISLVILETINYGYVIEFILLTNLSGVYSFMQFTTRGLKKNRLYAVQGIVYAVVLIISNVIFVIGYKLQTKGLLWSKIIADIITILFLVYMQRGHFNIKKKLYDLALIKKFIQYSLPIVPNNIAWWMVSAANKLVINWRLGDSANGIYAISLKFPTLVSMLSTFFYQAWQEQAITEYESEKRDAYYSKVFNVYMVLMISGILVLFPITKIIILYFMDSMYSTAYKYAGILYLAAVFNAFASFYGTGYLSTKKTTGAFITTGVGALINVLITVILSEICGLYAAAIGSMLGYLLIWILRIVQTRKYYNISIEMKKLFLLIVLAVLINICVEKMSLIGVILIQIVCFAIFYVANHKFINGVLNYVYRKVKA